MPVKIQDKKKKVVSQKVKSTEVQESQTEQKEVSTPTQQTTQTTSSSVDLSNFLSTMSQMMSQQNEMMKMMDERMKKLEEQNVPKVVEGEIVQEPEVVVPLNEDNIATYDRENEEWYAEIVNRVWKILYITAQAPVMRWMQDAAPMMEPVCEKRKVWNMFVSDTKYFDSEDDAKAYIENLRRKGINLPGAKIIPCYI